MGGAELRRMTLDEKIGQLVSVGVNATFLNQESDAFRELRRQVEQNHIGGIILFRGAVYESAHLVNRMQALARRPLLISADLEAGSGMRFDDTINFPWNMAVGATGNPEYARRQGEVTAREARAMGVQQIFAPVVDVNNNAANPVINVRSYGETAAVARMAADFTEGAQAAASCPLKNFPGHGDPIDSHRGLPVMMSRAHGSMRELGLSCDDCGRYRFRQDRAHGLPRLTRQGQRICRARSEGQATPTAKCWWRECALPGTLSPPVVGGLLRRDLAFDGIVRDDALAMSGLTIYLRRASSRARRPRGRQF